VTPSAARRTSRFRGVSQIGHDSKDRGGEGDSGDKYMDRGTVIGRYWGRTKDGHTYRTYGEGRERGLVGRMK
jgi:hypothetical protein